jgi:hypothetical protein
MRIEIYEDKPVNKETVLRLRLVEPWANCVALIAVDNQGNKLDMGNILFITSTGELVLAGCIGHDVPVQKDKLGKIKISGEHYDD